MHSRSAVESRAEDRGSVAAEFVVAVPAVMLVLAVCLGGIQLGVRQLQVQDAAALAARSTARGDDATRVLAGLAPGASVSTERRGNLVCASVNAAGTTLTAILGASRISATSCALAHGR